MTFVTFMTFVTQKMRGGCHYQIGSLKITRVLLLVEHSIKRVINVINIINIKKTPFVTYHLHGKSSRLICASCKTL